MIDKAKQLVQNVTKEQFLLVSGGDPHKITKPKFKQFLAQKYGQHLSEKLSLVLDFSGLLDFKSFQD